MRKRLFFSVGEPSGDLHAANLIRALLQREPELSIRGFGGARMTQAGCRCDFDLTSLAVVGFAEVLPKLTEFFRVADMAEDLFRTGQVDGVVLVDFPGFNWHIAKRAKKYGLPVYYYLPPQLWAWGGWRVRKLRRYVDLVFCHLPFEESWFREHRVTVEPVGHPFFDAVRQQPIDTRFIERWRRREGLQVTVLPGSRANEVEHIWPMQVEVIRRLHARYPDVRFLVAALKDQHALRCRARLSEADRHLPIEIFVGKTSELIELADVCLLKSGSVSLELMARETPGVVLYHVSRSTYCLARLMTRLRSITLPNLIAGKTILPEFLAVGGSNKAIDQTTEALSLLLGSVTQREAQRRALRELALQYAQPGASQRTAERLLESLGISLPPPLSGTLPLAA